MIEVTWIGWDGSIWDLTRGPVRLTSQSFGVLGVFESEAFVSKSAYVDGQRLDRWKASSREFDFQVEVGSAGPSEMEWLATEAAWQRSMLPGRYGQLVISPAHGGVRTLTARMESEVTNGTVDPSVVRSSILTYGMVADDPWWYGRAEAVTFEPPKEAPLFFGATGFGPPFTIASSTTPAAAVILNSGDVDAWPVWTFYGPSPRFEAKVGTQSVAGDFDLLDGEWVTVDTRPFKKSAIRSDGTNVTRQLSARRYTRISPGEDADVSVALFPGSRVEVRIEPQFFRGY